MALFKEGDKIWYTKNQYKLEDSIPGNTPGVVVRVVEDGDNILYTLALTVTHNNIQLNDILFYTRYEEELTARD